MARPVQPLLQLFGRIGNQSPAGQIDRRHIGQREGQKQGGFETRTADFQQIARAVIVHGTDPAQQLAAGIAHLQPDQVGVIEFAFLGVRQLVARDVELDALQRLCVVAIGDAGEALAEGVKEDGRG